MADISFERTITQEDVDIFITLTQDNHPLHTNDTYAKKYGYKKKIVHGLLTGSFFSTIVGKLLPGQNYKYLSQSMIFHQPVYVGEKITITARVTHESAATGVMSLKTIIYNSNTKIVLSGEAKVRKYEK